MMLEIKEIINRRWVYIKNVTLRNNPASYRVSAGMLGSLKRGGIVGIIRVRNEELVIKDTLDHMSSFVDGVILYDDASTDSTVNIAINHPLVVKVIVNKKWRKNRAWEETANRQLLLSFARRFHPKWLFYFDADERFEGDIKSFLESKRSDGIDGIRIQLFDAYMTPHDNDPYTGKTRLLNFREKFGPEGRDILMIWRNRSKVRYLEPDSRQPMILSENVITSFFCQHYGKALSVEQWEETCRYYYENFPEYSAKWKARFGKAIHKKSDFDTELLTWDQVKKSTIRI